MVDRKLVMNAVTKYRKELEKIAKRDEEPFNKVCWTVMMDGFSRLDRDYWVFQVCLPMILNGESIGHKELPTILEPWLEDLVVLNGMSYQDAMNYVFVLGLEDANECEEEDDDA